MKDSMGLSVRIESICAQIEPALFKDIAKKIKMEQFTANVIMAFQMKIAIKSLL